MKPATWPTSHSALVWEATVYSEQKYSGVIRSPDLLSVASPAIRANYSRNCPFAERHHKSHGRSTNAINPHGNQSLADPAALSVLGVAVSAVC